MIRANHLMMLPVLLASVFANTIVHAQQASRAQAALDEGARTGKIAFIVFYKVDSATFRKMSDVVKAGVKRHDAEALTAAVATSSAAEQAVIEKFQLSRAPMPLTLAVAPNGAVTGIFAKELTEDRFEDAFVTPKMMVCMKSLQEDRLVFVCVQKSEKGLVPAAVKDMQADPEFKNRIVVVSVNSAAPEEAKFLNQMKIDPKQTLLGTTAVLLAPPGILIGKFDSSSTATQIASALHEAGKCCDDPNCKHNQAAPAQATRPTASKRK